jgi:dTDP-4-amino-4,6-dideoxygalactose transaminase
MQVPLLDLTRQYNSIKSEIDDAVMTVLAHCKFIGGPEVKKFEDEVAAYCGVKYGIGVNSGTDALLIALRASGVGHGDEVVTTTFSFFATAGVISRLGARPVFVDIDPESYNIDIHHIEKAITPRTKAVMPVHLFGQCADMDAIISICRPRGIKVVEDAAQALSADYKGRKAGTIGDFGCFSFFPSKNLGAAGDAGMIVSDRAAEEDFARILRVHGSKPKYYHSHIGYNSRLDTIQAAVLSVKLKYLSRWSAKRHELAHAYDVAFADVEQIKTPYVMPGNYHIYHQYTVAVPDRDRLRDHLLNLKIGCETYYPVPLHAQECYKDLGYKPGDLPVAEKAAREVISLPVFPELTSDEQQHVIDTIRAFYRK